MKFSCGLTEAAKKAAALRKVVRKAEHLKTWHKVFLWWPTEIGVDGDRVVCAWLTTVERRYPRVWLYYGVVAPEILGTDEVEYREVNKENKNA